MGKEIELNVKANTIQAQKSFDDLNKSVNNLSKGSEELSDSFVDAQGVLEDASETVEDVKSKFAGLAGKLIGAGGVVAALLLAKEAVRIISNEFRSTEANLTDLTGQLKKNYGEVYKAAAAWSEFRKEIAAMNLYELRESLDAVNRSIEDLGLSFMEAGFAALGFTSATIKLVNEHKKLIEQGRIIQGRISGADEPTSILGRLDTQIKINEELRGAAQTTSEITNYTNIITELQKTKDELLGKEIKGKKEVTKELGKQISAYDLMIQQINEQRAAFQKQINLHRAGQTRYGGLLGPFPVPGMVDVPKKPEALTPDMQRELQQREQDMLQFAQATSHVFAMNMNQAWQSIFGEANSMFEQMISAWANMLFEKVGFGIFNMLFGGIDFFGFARNVTSGQAAAGKYRMNK